MHITEIIGMVNDYMTEKPIFLLCGYTVTL